MGVGWEGWCGGIVGGGWGGIYGAHCIRSAMYIERAIYMERAMYMERAIYMERTVCGAHYKWSALYISALYIYIYIIFYIFMERVIYSALYMERAAWRWDGR